MEKQAKKGHRTNKSPQIPNKNKKEHIEQTGHREQREHNEIMETKARNAHLNAKRDDIATKTWRLKQRRGMEQIEQRDHKVQMTPTRAQQTN